MVKKTRALHEMSHPDSSTEMRHDPKSLVPSSVEELRTSRSRAVSPAAKTEDTTTVLAWRNARDAYRKSLPDKDFARIMIPARPEDVLEEIRTWESRQRKSKYRKVSDSVQAGISRLQKFNRAIDMIAQGSPAPGCLVWGSIIFVLTITRNAAEEYNKLCKALTRMAECLPRVELYTETFLDSNLVQDCVNAFYSSVLRFWTRACKFYRRDRLWNFVRVIWNDYDVEFGELEIDMVRCQDRVEASALANHIGESKVARTQQQTVNMALLEAQNSSRQKDIIAWLAPIGYGIDYYMEDFANAKAARHTDTCRWLLARDTFVRFSQTRPTYNAFLWIYAQPGAGKTVLAAFLVDHFASCQRTGCVIFFFCKDTDDDKRTPIAVARSLLYQLFLALRERLMASTLIQELSDAMDESGHKTALSFPSTWRIFSNHISDLAPATIIVDALDECRDSDVLIQNLRSLASSCDVAVILTSRKEEHLYQLLHQGPSLEVSPDDIDVDIKAFVEAKVAASPRLSQPSVKQLIIRRLCESHEGMFLWVHYIVKELKSCVSLEQVQEELRELPKGLDAVYQRILRRLQETLDKQTFELCSKILAWVTTAIRPLKIEELRQALESHYLSEGHSLLSVDGSFPYSDKDIELVCGSLVTVRNDTLQVVHLTVKEYIKSSPGPTSLRLLEETKSASFQLTVACLSFLKHQCAEPINKLSSERPVGLEDDELGLSLLRSERPSLAFLDYACFAWLIHLIECTSIDALEVSRSVFSTFDSPSTFRWIESCMILLPDSVTRLLVGLEDVRDWIDDLQLNGTLAEESSFSFISNWCATMEQVLDEYGPVIKNQAAEIYYLDLAPAFAAHGLMDTYDNIRGLTKRDKCSRFPIDRNPRPARIKIPSNRQLHQTSGALTAWLGLFIYEPNRDIFIWSQLLTTDNQHVLYAQSASNGKRLPPVTEPRGWHDLSSNTWIHNYAMSKDGRHLAIVYSHGVRRTQSIGMSISIWEIEVNLDFTRRMQASSWARTIHKFIIDEPSITQLWSNPCVIFDRDGVCFTPGGLLHRNSGTISFIQDNPLQRLSARNGHGFLDDQHVFYSGNGKFLFVYSATNLTKNALPGLEIHSQLYLSERKKIVSMASPSGRYLVFVARDQGLLVSTVSETQKETLLVDTLLGNTVTLPHSADPEYMERDYVLHFSADEREVLAIYTGSGHLTICCYVGLPNAIRLRASEKCVSDPVGLQVGLSVSSDHKTARILTTSGEIQRIGLGDVIEFLDAPEKVNEYPTRSDFLSQDGSRWASVYHGNEKAQLHIHTMLNADETPQYTELQRTSSLSVEFATYVAMSMDLHMLVLDGDIYKVKDSKLGQLSIIPQSVKLPRELVVGHRAREPRLLRCIVDSSNSYVAYLKRDRHFDKDPIRPDTLALFRIDLDEASSSRMHLSLPEDMFDICLQFHPSLPLLILGYGLISEAGTLMSKDLDESGERVPFHMVIIDMNTMSKFTMNVEQTPDVRIIARYLRCGSEAGVAFSSSGDFAYVRDGQVRDGCVYPRWQMIKNDIESSSESYRYIQHCLAVDGAFYTVSVSEENTLELRLNKYKPVKVQWTAWILNLAHLSSSYAHRSQVFLLLGRTDNDYMRALMIPNNDDAPELRTVPLSWAKARAILDQKWEASCRQWPHEPGQDSKDEQAAQGKDK